MITFHNDGRVTLGENVKPDEAAAKMLHIITEMWAHQRGLSGR